jgi:phage-related holin
MVTCDTITGVIAAAKNNKAIKSRRLFETVGKFVSYGIGIIIARIIETCFIPNFPAVKLMAGYIAFIEVKSIDENIQKITGHSLFESILSKLKR